MKERIFKGDVVSFRNMVSGELVPIYPHYVLVVGRESDGDLVYIDPYDGEAYLLDEDLTDIFLTQEQKDISFLVKRRENRLFVQ